MSLIGTDTRKGMDASVRYVTPMGGFIGATELISEKIVLLAFDSGSPWPSAVADLGRPQSARPVLLFNPLLS